ncbi:hypothetical protein [Ahrensia sp. 13_GOM-1096m]|uniref:hypothetical protein n=1 Tax=Ahrensia sp. 13_GOM-1096m TaxID=1380380 RepID=UPI00047DB295|nr:hypothetical protein [Ahrensia sp. 13_GOM-1096m]
MLNLLTVLSMIGLASPIAFGVLLDRFVRGDIRESFATAILSQKYQGLKVESSQISKYYFSFVYKNGSFSIRRATILSVISLIFVASLQYQFNDYDYQNTTSKFLSIFNNEPIKFLCYCACFVIVDVLSFYQTARFVRLFSGIESGGDLVFIAFADIALSLVIFICVLPMFIIGTTYTFFDQAPRDIVIKLQTASFQQTVDIRDIISTGMPYSPSIAKNESDLSPKEIARRDFLENIEENKWIYVNPTVLTSPHANFKTENYAESKAEDFVLSGQLLYFESATETNEVIAERFAHILESSPNITSAEVLFSETGFLGTDVMMFRLIGGGRPSLVKFAKTYLDAVSDTNFLGSDLRKLISLGSKKVTDNQIVFNVIANVDILAEFGNFRYSCGEDPVQFLNGNDPESYPTKDMCKDGVLISETSLRGVEARMLYNYSEEDTIPILPFGFSSIFFSLLVYFSFSAWLLLRYTITKSSDVFDTQLVSKNVFTILISISVVLVVALYSLVKYLL